MSYRSATTIEHYLQKTKLTVIQTFSYDTFNPLRAYTRFRIKTDNTTTSPPISIMNELASTANDSEPKKLFDEAENI